MTARTARLLALVTLLVAALAAPAAAGVSRSEHRATSGQASAQRCPHVKRSLHFAVRHPQAGQRTRLVARALPRRAVTEVQVRTAGSAWQSVAVRQTGRCGGLVVRVTAPFAPGGCEWYRTSSHVVVDRDHARTVRTRGVKLCAQPL